MNGRLISICSSPQSSAGVWPDFHAHYDRRVLTFFYFRAVIFHGLLLIIYVKVSKPAGVFMKAYANLLLLKNTCSVRTVPLEMYSLGYALEFEF